MLDDMGVELSKASVSSAISPSKHRVAPINPPFFYVLSISEDDKPPTVFAGESLGTIWSSNSSVNRSHYYHNFSVLETNISIEAELKGQAALRIQDFEQHSPHGDRKKIATRLRTLLDALFDEGGQFNESGMKSLSYLLLFFNAHTKLSYPTIVITPRGQFRVQWRKDKCHHFAVEFFHNATVTYVVFCEDPAMPWEIRRTVGSTSWQTVLDVVSPFNIADWIAA